MMNASISRAAPLLALAIALAAPLPALAGPSARPALVEPHLLLPATATAPARPRLALTLDACSGNADMRIFSGLIANRIPATVFVTARWLKRNPETVTLMLAHPDLFQIENHGARHVPAVDYPAKVYGLAAAGSPEAVKAEVEEGARAVLAATGRVPEWFRGATARYSRTAVTEIAAMGQTVAGYSLRADDGATLPAAAVEKRLRGAKNGDVIIAHVNHPEKPAGEGLMRGLLALKAKGFTFVKLGKPPQPVLAAHAS